MPIIRPDSRRSLSEISMRKLDNFIQSIQYFLKKSRDFSPATQSVSISMVRNEQDIIEPFIRHNSKFLDLMIVLDNGSEDRTREILLNLARELDNVIITDWQDGAYNQAHTMTRALHAIQSAVFADFVFFLDADEFLAKKDKSDLLSSLSKLRVGDWGYLPWRTLMPDPSLDEIDCPDVIERMTLMRAVESPQYYKTVLRMGGGLDPRIRMHQGNHDVVWPSSGRGKVMDDLYLLHLPVRSANQILTKGALGWRANLARPDFDPKRVEGGQWKRLYDLQEQGVVLDGDALLHEARIYAQDFSEDTPSPVPFPSSGITLERKYSDGKFVEAGTLINASTGRPSDRKGPLPLPSRPEGAETDSEIKNAFDGDWHWDSLFLDEPPIRYAIELINPHSVLDIGCGIGLYPALYRHLGIRDVLGIDGVPPESSVLGSEGYQQVDLQQPLDLKRKFDLVVCLEVVEHIDPETTNVIIDSIERHADEYILFSMAEPGQPGHGHINCRNISEVLDLWADRGWYPDVPASLGLRALSSLQWFRRNLVLLRKNNAQDTVGDAHILKQIGNFEHIWTGQPTGQRASAFCEAVFEPKAGYSRRLF